MLVNFHPFPEVDQWMPKIAHHPRTGDEQAQNPHRFGAVEVLMNDS
jgi:hypothetical protein